MARLAAGIALLVESGRMALCALWSNKLRTSLTLLGIVIGVGTVVAMASVLSGLDRSMAESISSLGSGSIYLTKYAASVQIGGHHRREQRQDLTVQDAAAILRTCPSVAAVSPVASTTRRVSRGRQQTKMLQIEGAGADYLLVHDRSIASGRFFTAAEVLGRQRVCVMGSDLADVLFGAMDPLGLQVKIGSYTYRVIGLLAAKGSVLGTNLDELAVVPLATLQQERGWGEVVDYILIQPQRPKCMQATLDEIESAMRRRRGLRPRDDNDFGLTTHAHLMELYNNLTRAIYAVMLLVSGIALAVGGIGIMNMMLVSVKERTREIGIRRAVGARRTDVLIQFLAEATSLTVVGGAAGILLGALFALIVSAATPLPAALPVGVVALALGMATAVGLVFGIYPAWR
ncbi:MAG: ABC transporter permease, partial [Candidatus Eisenbacteria sp.]|nr:ABC transporter permease [Candidatus Eisenbacteria bacterium]